MRIKTFLAWLPSALLVAGLAGVVLVGSPAAAQPLHDPSVGDQIRTFPAGTQVGRLTMGVFPEASINRKPVRFAPGARIFDRSNLIIIPSMLTDPVTVRFLLEPTGEVIAAWLLTEDELAAARRRQ